MTNTPHDDPIETLLRRQFEGPVADEGFSGQLMARLPPRRRRTTWPLRAGVLGGAVACGLSLAGVPLLRAGWHAWLDREWSVPLLCLGLLACGLSWLALAWMLAEGDPR